MKFPSHGEWRGAGQAGPGPALQEPEVCREAQKGFQGEATSAARVQAGVPARRKVLPPGHRDRGERTWRVRLDLTEELTEHCQNWAHDPTDCEDPDVSSPTVWMGGEPDVVGSRAPGTGSAYSLLWQEAGLLARAMPQAWSTTQGPSP